METDRLLIRTHKYGDGKQINEAMVESIKDLEQWMPWADHIPPVEETEEYVRKSMSNFILREALDYLIFLKGSNIFIGCIGFPRLDWSVPKFEIGYWLRSSFHGNGYMTEAVEYMSKFAFDTLKAKRVEIHVNSKNLRSMKVAERLGFELEGVLKNSAYSKVEGIRDTAIYAKVN
jgi:RimJ/RimL family protein N-acetyltransferase